MKLQKSVPSQKNIGTVGQKKNISYDNTNNKHDTIFTGREICSYNSDFCEFLCMEFGGDIAKRVVTDYALGSIDGKTICWNITPDGRVLGGQVIGFDTNGNIKNPWLKA
jgi:hypothetical protein